MKTALKRSRGRRKRVVIPDTPRLEALLAEPRSKPRKGGIETVLVSSFGKRWTGDTFNDVRNRTAIQHVDDEGNARRKHLTMCEEPSAPCCWSTGCSRIAKPPTSWAGHPSA